VKCVPPALDLYSSCEWNWEVECVSVGFCSASWLDMASSSVHGLEMTISGLILLFLGLEFDSKFESKLEGFTAVCSGVRCS
jgi:hypothetical protein